MTEQELRFAVSCSRKEGYRMIFRQFYPYVYRIVWNQIHTIGSREDAEECVNDIFAEYFANFDTIEEGSLQGFLGVLARRRAVDAFRSLSRCDEPLSLDSECMGETVDDENLQENIEANLMQTALFRHIRSLGEPDASIIIMKYFYDCNSSEIAKILHMTSVAVRVRMNRALKKLKKLLSSDSYFSDRGASK